MPRLLSLARSRRAGIVSRTPGTFVCSPQDHVGSFTTGATQGKNALQSLRMPPRAGCQRTFLFLEKDGHVYLKPHATTNASQKRVSADDVKVRLAWELTRRGFMVRTEYRMPAKADRRRSSTFPVDVAVLDADGTVRLVAEAKPYDGPLGRSKQRQNYARCGVPAVLVGPASIQRAAQRIAEFLTGHPDALRNLQIFERFVGDTRFYPRAHCL
jgi:hypothetical protein